ncbi:MAG: 30S ribosomal protein S8 [Parcubacteria group bacterium]|jgi:small subunit ribosomal protein S8
MLDPISDMLTRIRNAQKAGHSEAVFPFSNLKLAVAKILEKENLADFVEVVKSNEESKFDRIRIVLKYEKVGNNKKIPVITEIKRVSKEGKRIYLKKDEIKKIKNGFGIAVISTSKGVMTGKEARKLGLGGEYICEVW